MELKILNHIVCASYNRLQTDEAVVNQIVQNTEETWQPDRDAEERGSNTKQGKIAEEIVEEYLRTNFSEQISTMSYDEIGNDNYEKHAPFDMFIWQTGTVDIAPIVEAVRRDISNTPNKFVRLSENTRRMCRNANVKIAEVKSTQIRTELKGASEFAGDYDDDCAVMKLLEKIKCEDDVFCYPHYKRSEANERYSIDDYCEYVKSREASLNRYEGEELRRKVLEIEREKQCCDVFIRVYLDIPVNRGFVMGWMKREHLLDREVRFKRMKRRNKSEKALYFAKNLKQTEGIDQIVKLFTSDRFVYANPYTGTDFYHKSKNCRFLSRVNQGEIIVFQSKEEAIAEGRFTRRCLSCFSD